MSEWKEIASRMFFGKEIPAIVEKVLSQIDHVIKVINFDQTAGLRSSQIIALVIVLYRRGVFNIDED